MAEYIDAEYVGAFVGNRERDKLSDSSLKILRTLITSASAAVASALENSGHTIPADGEEVPEVVKRATIGALIPTLYGRKSLDVPENYFREVNLIEQIRVGDMPIPELRTSKLHGVGGVSFTNSSKQCGRPPVFKDVRKLL